MWVILIAFLLFFAALFLLLHRLDPGAPPGTRIRRFLVFAGYIVSLLLFCFGLLIYPSEAAVAVDELDGGYTPFSGRHLPSLIAWYVLFLVALLAVWRRGRRLPPLYLVLCMVCLAAGSILSGSIVLHTGSHELSARLADGSPQQEGTLVFLWMPLLNIGYSIALMVRLCRTEALQATERRFKNPLLDYLNRHMSRAGQQPFWVLLLLLPVLSIVTLILVLLGQDYNSLVKVFTDTSTWNFSQLQHPPYLPHQGHYLCTVAACGPRALVRPRRLGKRYGHTIVVNRQLMIANAFEEVISCYSPRLHRKLRGAYDRYGLPLAERIRHPAAAGLTYILMKPAELCFLAFLYLTCNHPEQWIRKQYAAT